MPTSYNGWPVVQPSSPLLHGWVIPDASRTMKLRNGSAGFLLSHFTLWFHETIEAIDEGTYDDWAYAYREVRGSSGWSCHASGTAVDLNATRHPLGTAPEANYSKKHIAAIRDRLRLYQGCIRWGGDYSGRKDPMHFEINKGIEACEDVALKLIDTPRGKRILEANPGQKRVILS